jgi:hypothetical protein
VAIALSIPECQKLGVQDFTVVVGTKENSESTEIGKLLGNTAKNLAKGDAVAVDSQGHKVQLESVATIQKVHTARVVMALHLSADDIQNRRPTYLRSGFVPWSELEGNTWAAKGGRRNCRSVELYSSVSPAHGPRREPLSGPASPDLEIRLGVFRF